MLADTLTGLSEAPNRLRMAHPAPFIVRTAPPSPAATAKRLGLTSAEFERVKALVSEVAASRPRVTGKAAAKRARLTTAAKKSAPRAARKRRSATAHSGRMQRASSK
jgi:hypothetical protein